jgi:hypothetical protein
MTGTGTGDCFTRGVVDRDGVDDSSLFTPFGEGTGVTGGFPAMPWMAVFFGIGREGTGVALEDDTL